VDAHRTTSSERSGTKPVRKGLRNVLLALLTEHGANEDPAGEVAAHAAEVIADVLEAPTGNLTEELTARLAVVAEELCSSTGRFEVVPASVACARAFGLRPAPRIPEGADLERRIGEISAALSRAYACGQEREQRRLYHSLRDEYNISLDLLRNPANAQGGLPFLSRTRMRAAYLGLWRQVPSESPDAPDEDLTIELAGSFVSSAGDVLPLGGHVGIESFPPAALVSLARPQLAEITTVLPVRTATKDWGLLALVGPPRDVGEHGSRLLLPVRSPAERRARAGGDSPFPALQRGALRPRRACRQRRALGLDLLDGRVMLSDRWKAVVGCKSDEVGTSPGEWLGRVHPEDRAALDEGLHACTSGQSTALESEHRLRSSDGTYRWVHCRALAIPGAPAPATRLVGSITDITVRRDLEEQLRHQALHDSLTGLPNRALVLDRAERMLATARRTHGSVFPALHRLG